MSTADDLQTQPGLFVRQSSGLVRELGVRDAFSIGIGALGIAFVAFAFWSALLLYPLLDLLPLILISGLLQVIIIAIYSQLAATLPRSGGDFLYVSRIIHPLAGTIMLGGVVVVILSGTGFAWLYFTGTQFLPSFIRSLGAFLGIGGLNSLADTLSGKNASYFCGVGIGILGIGLCCLPTRVVTRIVFWTFIAGFIAIAAATIVFFVHSQGSFAESFDRFAGKSNAYQGVITSARKGGASLGFDWTSVFKSIAFAYFGFWVGFTWCVYAGGEVRSPKRTVWMASLLALVVGIIVVALCWLGMKHAMGRDFIQSVAYLSANDPSKLSGAPAFTPFYALLISHSSFVNLIISFGFFLVAFGSVLAQILVASRLVFAASFDRVLPTALSKVWKRTHAPVTSVVIVGIIAIIFLTTTVYSTTVASQFRNVVLILVTVYLVASIAVMILPWRRRDLYEAGPKIIGGTWFGLPPISIVGGVSAVLTAVFLYVAATQTQVNGGYDTTSVVTLIAVVVIGPIAYGISRIAGSRRGIDLGLAMRELPPE